MKLTKEQIQQIEGYLTRKGMKYIDIRFEVLDHISTDIENLIENKKYSFEDALNKVKDKWRMNFNRTSSLWLGWGNFGPKMLINKSIKIYKPLYFKSILLILLFGAIAYSFNYTFEYSLANYKVFSSRIIFSALILYSGIILFWYIKIRLKKIKTTYSFLYAKLILPNLFSIIFLNPFFNNSYITKDYKLNVLMFSLLFVFFLTFLGARYFYKNHLKSVANNKKYQLQ